MNCVIVIQLALLFYGLSLCYDVILCWVELYVVGNTFMIDDEKDMESLRISIFTLNCDKLLLSHDITLEYALY